MATRMAKTQQVLIGKTTIVHVHHAILYIDVDARLQSVQSETSYFHALWRTWTQGNNFLFLFLKFDSVLKNSTPENSPLFAELNEME